MPVNVILRSSKSVPLTTAEIDGNFSSLATAVNANTTAIANLQSGGGGGGGSAYTLPISSASVLGGVKVGSGLSITGDGSLSVNASSLGLLTQTVADGRYALLSSVQGVTRGSVRYVSAGTYSWTVPAGVTTVFVTGAAGGGGTFVRTDVDPIEVAGGWGQVCYRQMVALTPGETLSLTVGSGGASISVLSGPTVDTAGNGGNTSVGSMLVLVGGGGGQTVAPATGSPGTSSPPVGNMGFYLHNNVTPSSRYYGEPGYNSGTISSPSIHDGAAGYLLIEW